MPTLTADERAAIKAQIVTLNQQAQAAQSQMQAALQNRNASAAEQFRQQRDACNAQVQALTALLNPNSVPVVTVSPSIDETTVRTLGERFYQNQNHDEIHNAVLLQLLYGTFAAEKISSTDPKANAYNALRGASSQDLSRLNMPLYWLRNAQHAQALTSSLPLAGAAAQKTYPRINLSNKRVGENFFIRDFMQIYTQGNLSIRDIIITDDTIFSAFAREFDRWIAAINRYLQSKPTQRTVFGFDNLAHRDAIQLIPDRTADGIDRYGGAVMQNVTISGNVIRSTTALQGIFATDGAFKQLQILNNSVDINGEHTITISGMLSGVISGNTDTQGVALPADKIRLFPLRLGGGANINILGFKNKTSIASNSPYYYAYAPISGIQASSDLRQQLSAANYKSNAVYYNAVDMYEVQQWLKRAIQNRVTMDSTQWRNMMEQLVQKGFAQRVQ